MRSLPCMVECVAVLAKDAKDWYIRCDVCPRNEDILKVLIYLHTFCGGIWSGFLHSTWELGNPIMFPLLIQTIFILVLASQPVKYT